MNDYAFIERDRDGQFFSIAYTTDQGRLLMASIIPHSSDPWLSIYFKADGTAVNVESV